MQTFKKNSFAKDVTWYEEERKHDNNYTNHDNSIYYLFIGTYFVSWPVSILSITYLSLITPYTIITIIY